MSDFFAARRVAVTGGAGFLGSYVVERLRELGCQNIFVPRSKDYDLREAYQIRRMYIDFAPEIVIHLAAVVGGIGANQKNPGQFFYDNLMMGAQLMEIGRQAYLEKFVAIGTVCAYPKFTPPPFREADLWNGYPEETNAPYGLAKKMMLVQGQAYRQQYGFNAIFLLPANLYGPGDNFAPESSHVIPALIRKCCLAMEEGGDEVAAWGDGSATREFLYAKDAAEGILLATEFYNDAAPVNLGTGQEISIKGLAEKIKELTGYTGKIVWEREKPNGQPRRALNTDQAREKFGFLARTTLDDGLRQTIAGYKKTLGQNFL